MQIEQNSKQGTIPAICPCVTLNESGTRVCLVSEGLFTYKLSNYQPNFNIFTSLRICKLTKCKRCIQLGPICNKVAVELLRIVHMNNYKSIIIKEFLGEPD